MTNASRGVDPHSFRNSFFVTVAAVTISVVIVLIFCAGVKRDAAFMPPGKNPMNDYWKQAVDYNSKGDFALKYCKRRLNEKNLPAPEELIGCTVGHFPRPG